MSQSSKLKSLETKLAKAKNELANIDRTTQVHRDEISRITKEIEKLKENGPAISEHALLRYIERIHGLNIDSYRQQLAKEIEASGLPLDRFQSGKFPISCKVLGGGGPGQYWEDVHYHIVVKDGIIRTVEKSK